MNQEAVEYLYVAILGLVQGVAEFLPISSSGHLVIVGELLKQYTAWSIPAESATMNVALHFGSLLAIAVVYREDLRIVCRDPRTIGLILLATIPVGIVGLALKDQVESLFNRAFPAGCFLLITAALLLVSRRLHHEGEGSGALTLKAAVVVGLFQAVAILPGISRSGSTIAGGLMSGLQRREAARFSFLIAIPAIGGATLVKARDLWTGKASVDTHWMPVLLGTFISCVVGIVCLRWLIRLVVADRLHLFAIYCVVVGVATILWQLVSAGY